MIEVSTPALLFPAVSLLFLSYTNRFLHLAALIRQLHREYLEDGAPGLRGQIDNLRRRLILIRWMQLGGALSLTLCVASMVAILFHQNSLGLWSFIAALLMMGVSLLCLILEIVLSGGALLILLGEMDESSPGDKPR